jgi:hypothetical protein
MFSNVKRPEVKHVKNIKMFSERFLLLPSCLKSPEQRYESKDGIPLSPSEYRAQKNFVSDYEASRNVKWRRFQEFLNIKTFIL